MADGAVNTPVAVLVNTETSDDDAHVRLLGVGELMVMVRVPDVPTSGFGLTASAWTLALNAASESRPTNSALKNRTTPRPRRMWDMRLLLWREVLRPHPTPTRLRPL